MTLIEKATAGYTQNPETKYIEAVAAYIRVSTQEQKLHGLSLDAQKMKLQEYAEKHGMRIVHWYIDEGVSARKLIRRRPQLQKMIHDAGKGLFSRIIFIKLDRYFRSVAEYHECQKILNEYDVKWTATEEKYDLTTANGRAFVNMKLTIAELEADTTSERIMIVNDYKIKQGLPLCGAQNYPFYMYNEFSDEKGRKHVAPRPEYIEAARDMVQHYLKYQSKRKTLEYMNAKYQLGLSYHGTTNALTNTMIYGEYKGNRSYCEPIIDKATFDRVVTISKKNGSKFISKKPNRDYYFTGLIKCPVCGRMMAGTGTTKKLVDGTEIYYKHYKCPKKSIEKACSLKGTLSEIKLEKAMLQKIEIFLDEAKTKEYAADVKEADTNQHEYNIEEIQSEIDRLNYSWQKGRIKDAADYDRQYDDLTARLEAATEKFASVERQDFSAVEAILSSDWRTLYANLDDEHRKAFWQSFVKEIIINEDREITSVIFY